MAEECCTTDGNVMLLACAGGSNVGQLSNRAAVELTQEGYGKIFCLAGVTGRSPGRRGAHYSDSDHAFVSEFI